MWTLKRIAEVIGKLTDVHYNSNYVWELLHQWNWSGAILVVLVATSVYMKFNWYDKLEKAPAETTA